MPKTFPIISCVFMVARDRIELPTRGLMIPCSISPFLHPMFYTLGPTSSILHPLLYIDCLATKNP